MSDHKSDTDLEARLKAARQEFDEDYNPKPKTHNKVTSANIGYEFLGYVFSGGFVGFMADKYLGIAPWGIMAGMLLGFVGGVFRANARSKALASQMVVKAAIKMPDKTAQNDLEKNSEKSE